MGNYNRNDRGGGRGRGGGGDFRRRDSGPREMHKAVCDECGNNCEVPFKPRGDKPIYCSDCFEKKDGGSQRRPSRRGGGGSDRGRGDDSNKQLVEQLNSLNTKLDRILIVLESHVEKKIAKKVAPKTKKAASKKTEKK